MRYKYTLVDVPKPLIPPFAVNVFYKPDFPRNSYPDHYRQRFIDSGCGHDHLYSYIWYASIRMVLDLTTINVFPRGVYGSLFSVDQHSTVCHSYVP